MTPDLSFLIPVHGESPYVRQTVESVLNQLEVSPRCILILDRADARTVDCLRSEFADDVQLLLSQGSGLAAALNTGLGQADTKYVARLDADDLAEPARAARQIEFLEREPQVGVVGSDVYLVDEASTRIGVRRLPTEPEEVLSRLRWRNALVHPSVTARRQTLIDVGSYDPRVVRGQDYELWLRVARVSRIANIPKPLTSYRIHSEQVSRSATLRNMAPAVVRQGRLALAHTRGESKLAAEARHLAWVAKYAVQR